MAILATENSSLSNTKNDKILNTSTHSTIKDKNTQSNLNQVTKPVTTNNAESSLSVQNTIPDTKQSGSILPANNVSRSQAEPKTSPLLGNLNNFGQPQTSGFQPMASSTKPTSVVSPQTFSSIESWNNLTQTDSGLYNLKSLYPSNLLVKVDPTNKVEFVVKLRNLNDYPLLTSLFSHYNINIESRLVSLGVLVVWVPVNNVDAFLQATSNNFYISYVEPNVYYQVQYVPNDPLWSDQWGPQLIGMTNAWDHELGNRSVKVAVIDTGIDYNNPELKNNYLPIGYNWITNTSDPMDDNGHGTHVAGTIAAAINNGIGIAGLANVSIFAEKFLDSTGYGSDVDAALAINDAVAKGANILSNSWGGTFNSSLVANAVANAVSSGVIFVAAAGNLGGNIPFFPADLPGVIGVGATNSYDQRASFSDYGNYVDISAPGVNILSTYLNDTYEYLSGTSMATPHVSGLLALLMSKYPSYTPKQLENVIYNTAVDLGQPGWDPYYGYGRIDAAAAINGLQAHNLNAYLNTPSVFPFNLTSTFNLVIRNIGLNNESNINYQAFINGTSVNIGSIPSLNSSSTIDIPVNFKPTVVGTYNITLVVNPVPGETVVSDNVAMKYVQALTKQIDLKVGDFMSYNRISSDLGNYSTIIAPFSYGFNVTAEISPTAYNVSYIEYVDFGGPVPQPFTFYTAIVNPYTREMTNGPWGLFAYWINTTNLQINDTVDLFTKGGQEGTVVGMGAYNYYGVTIPILIINDSYELVYFDKDTGIVISDNSLYSGLPPYFAASYINVHPSGFDLYNLKGVLTDNYGSPNTTSQIYFLVMNTGTHFETSTTNITVNGTNLGNFNFNLKPGQFTVFNASWTPTTSGNFSLQLAVTPVVNETYLKDNFINATAISTSSYLRVHVYDGFTGQPISGAEVDIYDINYNLLYIGFTNANGDYQSPDLANGNYIVQVNAKGYYSQTMYITISTSGAFDLYFYLTPVAPRFLQILSPSNSSIINGGLVNVNYVASDIYSAQSISIFVNNNLIATSYFYYSSISNGTQTVIVPVFNNGTNDITLMVTWFDGSTANASITINSQNVVPMFYPKTGDYLIYRNDYTFTSDYQIINFTFGNWLSPTEINVTYRVDYYPSGTLPANETWFPVNILNGYINNQYFIANGFSFFFMTNLGYTNPIGHGSIGDIVPYNTWAQILTVNDSGTWNGIHAWQLTDYIPGDNFYFSKLTGILLDLSFLNGQIELYLVNTSFALTAPPPTIIGPGQVIYELGTTGNTISWNITGLYPYIYFISRDGTFITYGRWISGGIVTLNIDGLSHGTYNYTLVAYNVGDWYASNNVTVRVIDIPKLNSPPDITYKIGETGAMIVWNASDSDPNAFTITRNKSFVSSGAWRTGVNIVIAIDTLPIGTFSYKIVVTDLEGYNATDTVIVKVLPYRSFPTPGFDVLTLLTSLTFIAIIAVAYKKKKLKT